MLAPKDSEGNELKFQSPEAQATYKASINRIKNAIQLKEPQDRVPICLFPGMYPVAYAGMTMEEAMYDYDKCMAAFKKFVLDFKKEIVGDTLCLFGNVPSAMLKIGTPAEVKDYCKKLIDTAGQGGGFVMGNGAFFDHAKPENIQAMVDFTKEYGVYK